MGKVKAGLFFYLIADILTTTKHIHIFQEAGLDWLPWQPKQERKKKKERKRKEKEKKRKKNM